MKIRCIEDQDIQEVFMIYKPYIEKTSITFETEVPAYEEFVERVHHKLSQFPWLVCEADGEIIGYAYASRLRERAAYDWDAELSVYLKAEVHNQGVGTLLYQALEDILKSMHYVNLYGCITIPNEASIRLHQKLGYKPIGIFHNSGYKDGCWHDVLWMEKNIQPWLPPKPIIPFPALNSQALTAILIKYKKNDFLNT